MMTIKRHKTTAEQKILEKLEEIISLCSNADVCLTLPAPKEVIDTIDKCSTNIKIIKGKK